MEKQKPVEPEFIPDPFLDEEVNEALVKKDTNIIWGMVGTLASMEIEEWARHRDAIKARFNGSLNLGLLDSAIKKRQAEEESKVKVVNFPEKVLQPWEKLLHRNNQGDFKPVLINADLAIRNHPEWDGVLAFDEFKQKIRVVKQPPIGGKFPRDWTDADDTNTAVWMQSNGIYVGRDIVSSAVQAIAMERMIHCVRDYLNALTWDGVPRIDTWASVFLGAANNPTNRMIGSRWLISAIARIMNPGCQCDYMMVLEGLQGIKKSTALKILASQEWFCDHTPDLHDKDSQMQISGSWIVEWKELDNLKKSEVTAVKAFLDRRVEKFRPPYGRYVIEVPRQCVFAGTTNENEWNKDDTGARRFWPMSCSRVDADNLDKFRDQLWAESLTRFLDGSIWWPETMDEHALLTIEQNARMEPDPWQDSIERYLEGTLVNIRLDETTTGELLSKCLGLPVSEHDLGKKKRIGRVMKALGWTYIQERVAGTRSHFSGYRRLITPG